MQTIPHRKLGHQHPYQLCIVPPKKKLKRIYNLKFKMDVSLKSLIPRAIFRSSFFDTTTRFLSKPISEMLKPTTVYRISFDECIGIRSFGRDVGYPLYKAQLLLNRTPTMYKHLFIYLFSIDGMSYKHLKKKKKT